MYQLPFLSFFLFVADIHFTIFSSIDQMANKVRVPDQSLVPTYTDVREPFFHYFNKQLLLFVHLFPSFVCFRMCQNYCILCIYIYHFCRAAKEDEDEKRKTRKGKLKGFI